MRKDSLLSVEDKKKLHKLFARWLAKRLRPINLLRDPEFIEIVHILNPGYSLPTTGMIKVQIMADKDEIVEAIIAEVDLLISVHFDGPFCGVQLDGWSSDAKESYIALSCTFV